jgi:hypothetical protein
MAVGLFNMPWSSDSNRKTRKENNPAPPRHFALDFGPEQSMHGLLIIGTASNSKLARVLPTGNRASARWRSIRRRPRSAISCTGAPAWESWAMAVGIDLGSVALEAAQLAAVGEKPDMRHF